MTSLPHPVESARLDETHLLQRRMTILRLDVEAWPNMERDVRRSGKIMHRLRKP